MWFWYDVSGDLYICGVRYEDISYTVSTKHKDQIFEWLQSIFKFNVLFFLFLKIDFWVSVVIE